MEKQSGMPRRKHLLQQNHRRRGFTALEISMVATVIAILALIVMPIFRNRVEEAKLNAAQADLTNLMKAEILAHADTGYYYRLEDLDNVANNIPPSAPALGITLETPPFVFFPTMQAQYRGRLSEAEWKNLAGSPTNPKFKGPYISFQKHETYENVRQIAGTSVWGFLMYSTTNDPRSPIWDLLGPGTTYTGVPSNLFDSLQNRLPVDPWGNPYLFFPTSSETNYYSSRIYSLGPDGRPGDLDGSQVLDYRPGAIRGGFEGLGAGDDLKVEF